MIGVSADMADRLSAVDFVLLREYPYRVVINYDDEFIERIRSWVVARHGGIGIDRPVCRVVAGNYAIYGFRDKAEAAMFKMLFFEAV